jgi:hypothetical protein
MNLDKASLCVSNPCADLVLIQRSAPDGEQGILVFNFGQGMVEVDLPPQNHWILHTDSASDEWGGPATGSRGKIAHLSAKVSPESAQIYFSSNEI